jgi:hypothetical protein
MNWIPSTNNPFASAFGYRVAWNGSYWIAVGGDTNSIAKSYDGMNWTPSTNNPFPSSYAYSVAWNGTYWIVGALNTGGIFTSTDGMNWISANKIAGGGIVFPNSISAIASRRVLPNIGTKISGNFQAGPTGPYARGGVGDYYIDTSGQELYKFYTATGPSGPTGGWTGIMPIGSQALYTPADPSKWASTAPTTVQQAIDRMAALLYTLNSDTAIP